MARTLREGSRGLSVETLQRRLSARGFGPLEIDGRFGSKTAAAVRQFQLTERLTDDGIVGLFTWAALNTEIPLAQIDDTATRQRAIVHQLAAPPIVLAVLCAALKWLDAEEIPLGSNRVPNLTDGYAAHWGIPHTGQPPAYPWCAIAVSQWIRQGLDVASWSRTPMGFWFGGVWQFESWAADGGGLYAGDAEPEPGDVFTMGRAGSFSDAPKGIRAGHCGLVLWSDGDHIQTIEGNTSNRVRVLRRPRSAIRQLVRWRDRL